jgi:hypothetical protein
MRKAHNEVIEDDESFKQNALKDWQNMSFPNDAQQSKSNTPKLSSNAGNANDKSSHGGNKRKQRKYHVSDADSGRTNGCMSHS